MTLEQQASTDEPLTQIETSGKAICELLRQEGIGIPIVRTVQSPFHLHERPMNKMGREPLVFDPPMEDIGVLITDSDAFIIVAVHEPGKIVRFSSGEQALETLHDRIEKGQITADEGITSWLETAFKNQQMYITLEETKDPRNFEARVVIAVQLEREEKQKQLEGQVKARENILKRLTNK